MSASEIAMFSCNGRFNSRRHGEGTRLVTLACFPFSSTQLQSLFAHPLPFRCLHSFQTFLIFLFPARSLFFLRTAITLHCPGCSASTSIFSCFFVYGIVDPRSAASRPIFFTHPQRTLTHPGSMPRGLHSQIFVIKFTKILLVP